MLCAKEFGYSKFIIVHKKINMSLQQGLARTRNSEGENMQTINQNRYICIKKTAKNNVHVNIFALARTLSFFFTPRYYLQFLQMNFSYFVRRYLSVFVL